MSDNLLTIHDRLEDILDSIIDLKTSWTPSILSKNGAMVVQVSKTLWERQRELWRLMHVL